MTNTLNTPAEAIELQYPLRVRRFERARGTGGAGAHRGGDGIIRELQALAPCEGTLLADRRVTRPYGLGGGSPGAGELDQVVSASGQATPLKGKTRFSLKPGDVLSVRTPGGGGWSDARATGSLRTSTRSVEPRPGNR
jgi:N-methylhydantoinase B